MYAKSLLYIGIIKVIFGRAVIFHMLRRVDLTTVFCKMNLPPWKKSAFDYVTYHLGCSELQTDLLMTTVKSKNDVDFLGRTRTKIDALAKSGK